MRLQGKTIVVTAAGQGIGRATALGMAKEGATVWATDLNPDLLKAYEGVANIKTSTLNVLKTDEVNAFAKKVGTIDVLFNCAGFVHQGDIMHLSEDEWDFSMDLNVKSMYRTIRAFLPGMLEKGQGSVINMASAASTIKGAPNRVIYSASKAAVIGLTRALAADYVSRNIRFNSICPGTIESPSLGERIQAVSSQTGKTVQEARDQFIARQPIGRLGKAEEIAYLAIYLASDESAFTTGTAQIIDGGWSL
ncbi:SDR family oxidoreductase [Orrella sp. NBD-18]|uniref:SDR family oxidoreductase n=1 Tax=Sheuella amnicola TaxID=2707330 RepID=A0A6B2QYS8_9BURK|nr:SDR family oxidoreductase [Sheuella amnicola]NDY83181.1 SDR family oxidoreductase [Sheuella amnicola]HBI82554.1 NAD(P)-dependent oxidoreductase [Alcaligenaceae bacterium]